MDFQRRTQNVEVGSHFKIHSSALEILDSNFITLDSYYPTELHKMKNAPIRGIGYWLAKEVVS